MRRHLSIFGFKTVETFPRPTRAFYWSIIWLCGLFFTGNLLLKPFLNLHTTRIGNKLIACLNNNVSNENNKNEFIIFLGSSRFQSAINTKTLTEMSHVKNVTFLNLSLASIGPWEYSVVLRNSEIDIPRVKLIILEISPWMFNANALEPHSKKRMSHREDLHRWGTIRERLKIQKTTKRIKAMTIGMIPRNALSDYISAFKKSEPIFELGIPIYHVSPEHTKNLRDDPVFKAENISRDHLYNYKFLQSEANILLNLVKELDKAGVTVALVHPPVRSEYYDYLDTDHSYRAEFEKYKNFIKSLSKKHHVVYWEKPPDAGMDNSIFVDYGHFSKEGCELFSRRLNVEINQAMK